MILIDKVHQLFQGHNLILLSSSQETFSFLGWKLRMSVICLCLLDVQTEAAASGGHVPGDPRQVECTKLQHIRSELLKFQEGAWALQLPGACAGCGGCGAQGTWPGEALSVTSSMAPVVLGCLTVFECVPDLHQEPCPKLALSIATSPSPNHPRTQSKSIHFPSLLLLTWSSFTEASVCMNYLELSWSDHWLFPNEQGLGMKRSRTVPYAGIGITGTKDPLCETSFDCPSYFIIISEKSLCLKCMHMEVSKSDTGCVCVRGVNQQQPQSPVLPLADFTFCLSGFLGFSFPLGNTLSSPLFFWWRAKGFDLCKIC